MAVLRKLCLLACLLHLQPDFTAATPPVNNRPFQAGGTPPERGIAPGQLDSQAEPLNYAAACPDYTHYAKTKQ